MSDTYTFSNEPELPPADAIGTISTLSTAEHAGSPFLRLPAELRNRIYAFALLRDEAIKLQDYCMHRYACARSHASSRGTCLSMYWGSAAGEKSAIHILRVNRQICHEATAIFYGMNTLALSRDTAGLFLSVIGKSLCHLRSIAIDPLNMTKPLKALFHYLPPKLDKIYIHARRIAVSFLGPPEWSAYVAEDAAPFVQGVSERKNQDLEKVVAWFSASQSVTYGMEKTLPEASFLDEVLSLQLRRKILQLVVDQRKY
ncbi:hypothetical protein Slin15195_G122380 [Septoria linicola]|uniref:DUF7730 domain-containing protein n=1 Tax=Septoria linicola TaxID=215465 RepID=A0A9Q9EQL9_9PEZI|nr:hypothetical protein Slin14017_G078580 [Septoria linicola]USW58919.1 hypothetical protein Slin15195_G122380 [Septoria linicola]